MHRRNAHAFHDGRRYSADEAALGARAVAGGIGADPAFVGGLTGALITRVGREADAVGLVVHAAVDHVHLEREKIARPIFRREPAPAEAFAQHDGVAGQPAGMAPAAFDLHSFDVGGIIFAVEVDVDGEVIFQPLGFLVRILEQHEAADLERHFAVGNPARQQFVRATAHVNEIAVRRRTLAVADRAKPRVVEVAHGFAKKLLVKAEQLGAVDHAIDGAVVEREVAAISHDAVGARDEVVDGESGIECVFGGETRCDGTAGGEDAFGVEETRHVKIAVLIEALPQDFGLSERVVGAAEFAEGFGRGVQFEFAGTQGSSRDHGERGKGR